MSIRNSMKLTQKKLKIRGLSSGESGDNTVWVQIYGELKYTIKVEVDLIPPMATSPKGKKEGVAFLHVHATTPGEKELWGKHRIMPGSFHDAGGEYPSMSIQHVGSPSLANIDLTFMAFEDWRVYSLHWESENLISICLRRY